MKKTLFVLSLIFAMVFSACTKKEENLAPKAEAKDEQAPKKEEIYKVDLGTAIFRGPEDAPVTVVNFSDFQCPFSKRSVDLMEGLLKKYNGKVRYVFKHFPLSFHKWAKPASHAAIAAQNQGKFWEFYAKLYSDVKNINEETIVAYAKELKLDMDKFDADRKSAETAAKVQADITQGSLFGVRGTPTLFINGIRIVGANSAKIEDTITKQIAAGEQLKAKGVKDPYAEIVKNGKTKFIPPKREAPAVSQDVYKVEIPAGAPIWGAEDATVTLVLFDDFECPFCARLYATYEQLKKDYAGKIRIAFINRPLGFHKKAKDAAYLAAAAHKQGKFWEVYSFLFTKQKEWNRVPDFKKWLEEHKADIPADWETLKKDMESKSIEKLVEDEGKLASELGVRGTPATFVNGRFISGALPIDSFKKVIDEELRKAEGKSLKGDALYREIIKDGKPAVVRKKERAEKEDPNKVYQIKLTGKEAAKGSAKPKVTIIEFSDFQCPFCGKAFSTVEGVAEKHKDEVRVIYKNLPLSFHKEAKPAALMAHAVKKLYGDEKFFKFAGILYSKQNEWKKDPEAKFESYVNEIGCDWAKVKAEAAKPETEAAVSEDIREAGNHNIRSVPAFFVNGRKVSGAKPAEFFESMIETFTATQK